MFPSLLFRVYTSRCQARRKHWENEGLSINPPPPPELLEEAHRDTEAMQVARQCDWGLFMHVSDQLEWTVTFPIRLWHFCKIRINTAI